MITKKKAKQIKLENPEIRHSLFSYSHRNVFNQNDHNMVIFQCIWLFILHLFMLYCLKLPGG